MLMHHISRATQTPEKRGLAGSFPSPCASTEAKLFNCSLITLCC